MKYMRFNEYVDQMGDKTYVPDCSLLELQNKISGNIDSEFK